MRPSSLFAVLAGVVALVVAVIGGSIFFLRFSRVELASFSGEPLRDWSNTTYDSHLLKRCLTDHLPNGKASYSECTRWTSSMVTADAPSNATGRTDVVCWVGEAQHTIPTPTPAPAARCRTGRASMCGCIS